jgi:hypothetical protein
LDDAARRWLSYSANGIGSNEYFAARRITMRTFHEASYADRSLRGRLTRVIAAAVVIAMLLVSQVTFAGAGALVPAVDTGGPGGGSLDVAEMLRGDNSPIDTTETVAVTKTQQSISVAEMLRGDNSPIESEPEIAVTRILTVAEQLRGDLSPIALGTA